MKTRLSRPLEGPNGEDRKGAEVGYQLQMSEGGETSSKSNSAWDGTTIIPQGLFYLASDRAASGRCRGEPGNPDDQLYSSA